MNTQTQVVYVTGLRTDTSEISALRAENARLKLERATVLADKALSTIEAEDGRLCVTIPDIGKGARKLALTEMQWQALSLLITRLDIAEALHSFRHSLKL